MDVEQDGEDGRWRWIVGMQAAGDARWAWIDGGDAGR